MRINTEEHPVTPEKFMTGAGRYLRMLEIAVDSGEPLVEPMISAASQCVELALKAYLLQKGWTEKAIRKEASKKIAF